MLRLSRLSILPALLAAALLAGCGFQPLYGRAGVVEALRGVAVQVAGRDRADHLMQEALYDRFGSRATGGAYRLAATTTTSQRPLGVSADAVASRYVFVITVTYALYREGVAEPLLTGRERTEASYDVPLQPYGALAAQRDAEERAARDAAERIALRVSRRLHAATQP